MTAAEAAALLTPEQLAHLDDLVAAAPPLSDAQETLLAALFGLARGSASGQHRTPPDRR
jgi:hypothetical protein